MATLGESSIILFSPIKGFSLPKKKKNVTENDFFDYEAKYEGKSKEITPANISKIQQNNVTKIAKKIYQKLRNSSIP